MNWCTVDHSTGATSIDFDREIERIFGQTSPEKEGAPSSRSASTASIDTESSSSASVESRSPPIYTTRQRRCLTIYTCLTDLIILKCVDMFGPRWRFIARHLGGPSHGWTDDMVRNRFIRINPSTQTQSALRNESPKTHTPHTQQRSTNSASGSDRKNRLAYASSPDASSLGASSRRQTTAASSLESRVTWSSRGMINGTN